LIEYPYRKKRRPRLRLPRYRLKRLDWLSVIGVVLLALYLGFVEDDSPLTSTGEVQTLSGLP